MEEALIKRVMPHNIEAEQSVIGSMLMDKEAIMTASEIISGDDFYQKQFGILFDNMVELFNEGKAVDLVTLQNRLKENGVPEEVSNMGFVRELLGNGAVFGYRVFPESMNMLVFVLAPGAFITLGLLMAIVNSVKNRKA